MPYVRNKLSAARIKSLPSGIYGDGGGLALRKRSQSSGQWIYRFRLHGRSRQMGLGSLGKISLAAARRLRDEYEALVAEGIDPIKHRKKLKRKTASELVTLSEVSSRAFEALKPSLREEGKAGRWESPIKKHILPKLGDRPIVHIDQADLKDVLHSIWQEKPDTARKAINRLKLVYDHAAAMGLPVDLQNISKAKALLGKQAKVTRHIPSMPWSEVPDFYASLVSIVPVQLALRMLILNPGPRSKPIRFLHIDHINEDIWTVPAQYMKGKRGKTKDFRVPLTQESLRLLMLAKPFAKNGYFFPNVTGTGVISDASMSRLMERRGLKYRPHGFRSSFRTWAAETNQRRDIAELCLAHKVYGDVEASYLRTDQFEQRKEIMKRWSDHVSG